MNQIVPSFAAFLVDQESRVRAKLKYDIRELEVCLRKYLDKYRHEPICPEKIFLLCRVLIKKYNKYGVAVRDYFAHTQSKLSWQEHLQTAVNLAAFSGQDEEKIAHLAQIQMHITINTINLALLFFLESEINIYSIALIAFGQTRPIPNWFQAIQKAYQNTFDPNQLIDAVVMFLREKGNLRSLQFEIDNFYTQLTNDECIKWYAHFSSRDSAYLLFILIAITQNEPISWLPPLTQTEKQAVTCVLEPLEILFNGLNKELKKRHIEVKSCYFQLVNEEEPNQMIREVVYKILTNSNSTVHNQNIDYLFQALESTI